MYILRGYRLNHNSFWLALKSLFSYHNESVNTWSHLIGALFFIGCIVHLTINMHPPVVRNDVAHFEKWIGTPTGRLDNALFCIEPEFFKPEVCEVESTTILHDLLETEFLDQELKRPSKIFYHLDHHHDAFERIEAFLRNAIKVFSEPQKHLYNCASCFEHLVRSLPGFVDEKVRKFATKLHNYNSETMATIEGPVENPSFTRKF
jgi:hypothetical protein